MSVLHSSECGAFGVRRLVGAFSSLPIGYRLAVEQAKPDRQECLSYIMRPHRAEREFGLIVGGVFTLLSIWWLYRGKFPVVAPILLTLGMVLVLLGLIFPRALVYPNKFWMLLASVLGFVSTRIILGLVFFLLVTPIGVAKRMFGWDPLSRRSESRHSYWRAYPERQRNPHHYEKMY